MRNVSILLSAAVFLGMICLSCDREALVEDFIDQQSEPGFKGIAGGEETEYEEWQGVVGMFSAMGLYASICTGTMLAPDIILSAAHCVYYSQDGQSIDYVNNPDMLQVMGGSVLGDVDYGFAEKVVKHPSWQGNYMSISREVDLSMIKLERPIKDVEAFKVRKDAAPQIGDDGWLVGYGMSVNGDDYSAGTHRAGTAFVRERRNRVLGIGSPSSTCQGDSGGPFFTEQDGAWVVSAVTSYGRGDSCLPNDVGYSVNLVTYRKWIEDTFFELAGYELDGSPDEEEPSTDADVDGDADADGDADGDADTDGDADGDSDGDTDSDTDSDTDTVSESDADADGDGDLGEEDGDQTKNPYEDMIPGESGSEGCGCSVPGGMWRGSLAGMLLGAIL